MKKTTKKLVSLLTILAFMLTALVPSFAFAADSDPAAPAAATLTVEAVKAGAEKVTVTFEGLKEGAKVEVKKGDEVIGTHEALTAEQVAAKKVEITVTKLAEGDKLQAVSGEAKSEVVTVGAADPAAGGDKPAADAAKAYQSGYVALDGATEANGLETDPGEEVTVQVGFTKEQDRSVKYEGELYVWAEQAGNTPDANFEVTEKGFAKVDGKNIYKGEVKPAADSKDIAAKFTAGGKYRVYVSTADPSKDNWKEDGTFKSAPNKFKAAGNYDYAKVTSADVTVEAIGIKSENSPKHDIVDLTNNQVYGKDGKEAPKYLVVDPNGVSKTNVTAYIYAKDADGLYSIGKGKDVRISTNNSGITVDPEKATTDFAGKVKFSITGKVEGEYKVYVEAGNVRVTIPVKVTPLRANTIEKVDSPDYPVSTDMSDNKNELSFRIKDIDGNVVVNALSKELKENIVGVDGMRKQVVKAKDGVVGPVLDVNYEGDFIKVVKKPAASKLKASDLTLSEDKNEGVYYVNFKKDLVEGDYALKFTLDNGQFVEFAFTVKAFGTAKELKISYPQKYVELGYHSGEAKVQFIDENGVRKNALKYVTLGANGYALKGFDESNGIVTVENDEAYLGSIIQVTAVAEKEGLVADTELVVTDGKGGDKTLTFDPKNGPVNQANRVKVQVVDSKGNAIALGDEYTITNMVPVVVEKSEKDAKVSASISGSYKTQLQKDGTAEMIVRSDKATSADIKVTITAKRANDNAVASTFYRGTVHYVFSDKAEFAGRTVVMTINSNQVIVNNNIVTIDTAAIIKNQRTFVPFRALAEALGAEVDYNNDTRVVTAKMEGKTVAMTVDKDTYTVDGKEAKLDVAPYVQDNRTMIPVRFAAEALGYKVTPTYHADGTTASVSFQK